MKKSKSSTQLKKLKSHKPAKKITKPSVTNTIINIEDIDIDDPKTNSLIQELTIEVTPTKKLKPREREHYVNGREFEEEIRNYYKTDEITIKLGECINKIANGLSYATNFINYSYKEDMVGDAIVKMFSALKNKKFKLDSGFSPFSYFTTIAFHAFINRIKKEKKHHKTMTEYKEKVYNELMLDCDETNGAHIYVDPVHDDYSYRE
jgi:hypothetical protein